MRKTAVASLLHTFGQGTADMVAAHARATAQKAPVWPTSGIPLVVAAPKIGMVATTTTRRKR